jgi:hypothetical protein
MTLCSRVGAGWFHLEDHLGPRSSGHDHGSTRIEEETGRHAGHLDIVDIVRELIDGMIGDHRPG